MTARDTLLGLGRDELARGAYFSAHERWEEAWNLSVPPDKLAVQALAQLAAALVHLSTGNRIGATRLLEKARHKLDAPDTPRTLATIDVTALRGTLDRLRGELAAGAAPDLRAIELG